MRKPNIRLWTRRLTLTAREAPAEMLLALYFFAIYSLNREHVLSGMADYLPLMPIFFALSLLTNRWCRSPRSRIAYRLSPLAAVPFLWADVGGWVHSVAYPVTLIVSALTVFAGGWQRDNARFVERVLRYLSDAIASRADRAGGLSGLLRHFLLDRVHLQHTGRLLAGIHRIRGYGVAARRLARSVPDPRPGQRARSGQRLRLRPFSGRAVELYSHSRPADLHGHTVSLFREDRDRLVAAQRGNSLSRIRLHDHGARRAGEPDAVAAPPLRLVLSALRTDRPAGARDVLDRRAVSRAPVRLHRGAGLSGRLRNRDDADRADAVRPTHGTLPVRHGYGSRPARPVHLRSRHDGRRHRRPLAVGPGRQTGSTGWSSPTRRAA